MLDFKRSQYNLKQNLKQLDVYLHVNHVQSYSDKAPDTYFFKRRDVGRGAARSTVIVGFQADDLVSESIDKATTGNE